MPELRSLLPDATEEKLRQQFHRDLPEGGLNSPPSIVLDKAAADLPLTELPAHGKIELHTVDLDQEELAKIKLEDEIRQTESYQVLREKYVDGSITQAELEEMFASTKKSERFFDVAEGKDALKDGHKSPDLPAAKLLLGDIAVGRVKRELSKFEQSGSQESPLLTGEGIEFPAVEVSAPAYVPATAGQASEAVPSVEKTPEPVSALPQPESIPVTLPVLEQAPAVVPEQVVEKPTVSAPEPRPVPPIVAVEKAPEPPVQVGKSVMPAPEAAENRELEDVRQGRVYTHLLEAYTKEKLSLSEIQAAVDRYRGIENIPALKAVEFLFEDINSGAVRVLHKRGPKPKKHGYEQKLPGEQEYLSPVEMVVVKDWLGSAVVGDTRKRMVDLRGEARAKADGTFVEQTQGLWQYFAKHKWHLNRSEADFDHSGTKVSLVDKSDADAKVSLGLMQQADLDSKLFNYMAAESASEEKAVTPEFLERLRAGRSASEALYRLLVAGGQIKPDDEGPQFVVETTHRTVFNKLFTDREQFVKSDTTVRGLQRFLTYGNFMAYVRHEWSKLEGSTWSERCEELLDRPMNGKLLEKYEIVKKKKSGREYLNGQRDQAAIIQSATEILDKPEAELTAEGWLMESPDWGRVFVNVARSEQDNFPGGAAAVGAWGKFDSYLQVDVTGNSFLFRSFKDLTPEQQAKVHLPQGTWFNSMYLKGRDGQPLSTPPLEILRQFTPGYEPPPRLQKILNGETVEMLPRGEKVQIKPEVQYPVQMDNKEKLGPEIKRPVLLVAKPERTVDIKDTNQSEEKVSFTRELTLAEQSVKDLEDDHIRHRLAREARELLKDPAFTGEDHESFVDSFVGDGFDLDSIVTLRKKRYLEHKLPVVIE